MKTLKEYKLKITKLKKLVKLNTNIITLVNLAMECVDLAFQCKREGYIIPNDVIIAQCEVLSDLGNRPEYQKHLLRKNKLNRIV